MKATMILMATLCLIVHMCIQGAESIETYHVPSVGNCAKCPPGTHWKENCKENNGKSICLPCSSETFNSVYSQARRCEDCSICPIGTAEKTPCTSITDTICECPGGKYWKHFTGGEGRCMVHTKCKPDQKTIKAGTATEDTQCGPLDGKIETYYVPSVGNCEKCPPGTRWKENCKENHGKSVCMRCSPRTYNSVYSHANHCEHCSICPLGTAEKTPCTSITDTVCECPAGKYWKHFIGGEGKCIVHSACQPDQKTIKAGTATEDTQCGSLDETLTIRKTTEPEGGDDVDHGDSGSYFNRSNITILGMIPVVLTVYFLHSYYKRHRVKTHKP